MYEKVKHNLVLRVCGKTNENVFDTRTSSLCSRDIRMKQVPVGLLGMGSKTVPFKLVTTPHFLVHSPDC